MVHSTKLGYYIVCSKGMWECKPDFTPGCFSLFEYALKSDDVTGENSIRKQAKQTSSFEVLAFKFSEPQTTSESTLLAL